jgi:hypothetical protein
MRFQVSNQGNQVKVTLNLSGEATVILPGGKQFKGQLPPGECEQLAFRVGEITGGELACDPIPTDYVGAHTADVETLEKQAVAIDDLRTLRNSMEVALLEAQGMVKRLTDASAANDEIFLACQTDLKDARIEISALNEKLASVPEERPTAEEIAVPEEHTDEEPVL